MSERTKIEKKVGTKTGKMPITAAVLVCFALALCACDGKTKIPPPDSLVGEWVWKGDSGKQTLTFNSDEETGTLVSTMDIHGEKIPGDTYNFTYTYKKPVAELEWKPIEIDALEATPEEIAQYLPSSLKALSTFSIAGRLQWGSKHFDLQPSP